MRTEHAERERVLLMLLAAGPAARSALVRDTGWGIEETNAVADRLVRAGHVVGFPGLGNNQFGAQVLCLPEVREQALRQLQANTNLAKRARRGAQRMAR
jgi:hypothetical protein